MKRTIKLIVLIMVCSIMFSGCLNKGYSASEKKELAETEIKSDIDNSISVDAFMKYGTSDVDIFITSLEEDENTKITITDDDEDSIEPVAYRVHGNYKIAGTYAGEFEGVYIFTFFPDSKEWQMNRQSLQY